SLRRPHASTRRAQSAPSRVSRRVCDGDRAWRCCHRRATCPPRLPVGTQSARSPVSGLPSASSHSQKADGTFTDIAGIWHRHYCRWGRDFIPVAPLAFAPECQGRASKSLSPLVFLPVSTHFTATPEIPFASPAFKSRSFERPLPVGPGAFTSDFRNRLRALYAQ